MIVRFIFIAWWIAVGALAEEARFTAEEIEGLAAKSAWAEAILHMPEVATGDRGANWDELVERVAVGYLRSIAEEDPSNAMAMVDTLPQTYPSLRRSEKYRDAAEAIAYSGFKACFAQKEGQAECAKNLKEYFGRTVGTPDRAGSRFCADEVMRKSLGELCPARKPNPKRKRTKP